MVRRIRPGGVITCVAICLLLVICGCQKDRATAPAATVEPPAQAAVATEPSVAPPVENAPPEATPDVPEAEAVVVEPNEGGPKVRLVLGFAPGQVATYKVTTEAEKRVEWMGSESARPANYTGGRSGNRVEITFEQRVQGIRDNGNAVLEITIRALKYAGQVQSRMVFEFDSGKPQDQDNELAALIGKSYGLEMSPQGKVVALVGMESVRQAVKAGSPVQSVASKLFLEEVVRDRHEVPPLSALKEGQVRPGQSWSDLKSYTFGEMGLKGFERVYTLRQVAAEDGRRALVEMKAIPSAAMAEEMHKRQGASLPPGLFDNTEDYQGRLDFDLDAGRIREYGEEMWTEWVIVDPAAMQGTAQPAALKMGARRLYRLELVQTP
ncbi:MAG: DUF6263 family protein [Phycisphaerales bacterium]